MAKRLKILTKTKETIAIISVFTIAISLLITFGVKTTRHPVYVWISSIIIYCHCEKTNTVCNYILMMRLTIGGILRKEVAFKTFSFCLHKTETNRY